MEISSAERPPVGVVLEPSSTLYYNIAQLLQHPRHGATKHNMSQHVATKHNMSQLLSIRRKSGSRCRTGAYLSRQCTAEHHQCCSTAQSLGKAVVLGSVQATGAAKGSPRLPQKQQRAFTLHRAYVSCVRWMGHVVPMGLRSFTSCPGGRMRRLCTTKYFTHSPEPLPSSVSKKHEM